MRGLRAELRRTKGPGAEPPSRAACDRAGIGRRSARGRVGTRGDSGVRSRVPSPGGHVPLGIGTRRKIAQSA
jgi:hypothetical protein